MQPLLSRSWKKRFPFRLATTSFIYPAGWADNVALLAPYVDEIELVFFESAPESLPDEKEIDRLGRLAAQHGITYNVHLPIDLDLGSDETNRRRSDVAAVRGMITRTRSLAPTTYTIHLNFRGNARDRGRVTAWQRRTVSSLQGILDGGPPPGKFSVENLDYPFEITEPIVRELDLAICFDVGHLLLAGGDVMTAWHRYRQRMTIIHLYGIGERGEHHALTTMPRSLARQVIRLLSGYDATVSIEVFSFQNLAGSLEQLERLWQASITDG